MTSPTLADPHATALTRLGHALSHEVRARVLLELRRAPALPSELCARLGVTKQVMSNQLACLRGCGLVSGTPEGRSVVYRLSDPRLARALEEILGMAVVLDPQCCSGESCSCR